MAAGTEAGVRLWRTENDDELVLDGDPKATFLAYGPGDEIAEDDEKAAAAALKKAPRSEDKQEPAAPNKKADASANKSK